MTATTLELPVENFETFEDMVISLNGDFKANEPIYEQLERENPDFSFYNDVHLDSLIETLKESGLTENQITTFSLALYGPVIDFYRIGTEDNHFYVMAIGQR